MKTDLRLIEIFGKMIDSATIYLGRHVDLVNNMNVFPVPDGDTGTNMFNTLNGIKARTMNRSRFTHLSEYLNEISQAALYEGRGNSGIILSQILQGFASEFNTQKHLTTQAFATCLEKAKESEKLLGNSVIGMMNKEAAAAGGIVILTVAAYLWLM